MNPEILDRALRALATLLVVHAALASIAWATLVVTRNRTGTRTAVLWVLLAVYHVGLAFALDRDAVRALDIVFYWLHFGFVCRWLSSIGWYHRHRADVPTFAFHVILIVWGARQHYGASGWDDLGGERFSLGLLRRWLPHLGHAIVVTGVAGLLLALLLPLPDRSWLPLAYGLFAVIGIQVLTLLADVQCIVWSFFGHFNGFFGRFPFFRSKHVGQFWQNWNVYAIRGFQEVTELLNLRRRPFRNTMAVFFVSGVLHQFTVYFYTRRPSLGTLAAFLLHGLAVYVSGRLYRRRGRMPWVVRTLLFNPVTTVAILLPLSLPLALDFY